MRCSSSKSAVIITLIKDGQSDDSLRITRACDGGYYVTLKQVNLGLKSEQYYSRMTYVVDYLNKFLQFLNMDKNPSYDWFQFDIPGLPVVTLNNEDTMNRYSLLTRAIDDLALDWPREEFAPQC